MGNHKSRQEHSRSSGSGSQSSYTTYAPYQDKYYSVPESSAAPAQQLQRSTWTDAQKELARELYDFPCRGGNNVYRYASQTDKDDFLALLKANGGYQGYTKLELCQEFYFDALFNAYCRTPDPKLADLYARWNRALSPGDLQAWQYIFTRTANAATPPSAASSHHRGRR